MPDQIRRQAPRIIAITNQKGGVGKTTTSINLAAALVELGARVLLIDIDPQGNASTGLGIEANQRKLSSYDIVLEGKPLKDVIQQTAWEGLFIGPANADLASADVQLGHQERRTRHLRDALRNPSVQALNLDYILIDCPPSLSLLTVNALVAADSVLVPLQSEFFALEGLSQLMLTIREIRNSGNADLRIEGIVLTMYDARNRLSLMVERDARDNLGDLVFRTVIPRNVRLSEAPSYAQPVLTYDPLSKGSEAYRALAREVTSRHSPLMQEKGAA
ncbi:ParA family protein [Neogemmobacter tilapiae]|uniref:Chromosome partitioning protein ParA n=1 Tax=Neogemmobacter tilapiae TaxID=875041 RepID=A0A918WJB0_9RHOB|nr:ParA family protein [Gemmobacter tilapiae]GHC51656.1 chromosome partitioning protein ParA [Gemmobacter tilapiae]